MREALALAEKGRGLVSPNPLVGCVIVRDGAIVGRGYHRRYGACHAEVAAITDAGKLAHGATMYVSLQPCNHYGKTPPCTDAVIASRVKRLVIAAHDPNPRTAGRAGLHKIEAAGIETRFGVCEPEALRQNEVYFHNLKYGRPFVALKLAVTLDGRIADSKGVSKWISSAPSREYVQHLRSSYDAVLIGTGTLQADDPRLTCRLPGKRNPVRVILDDRLTLSPHARALGQPGRTIVFCAERASARRLERLEAIGVELHRVSARGERLSWTKVLNILFEQGIASVLVEGGAQVAASALAAKIVSKLYLFVAPKILGQGLSFSDGLGPNPLKNAIKVKEWRSVPVADDLLIEAYLGTLGK